MSILNDKLAKTIPPPVNPQLPPWIVQNGAVSEAQVKHLAGKKWSKENIEKAMLILSGEFTPISDARSGAEYRRVAAGNLLLKFYLENR